MMQIEVHDDAVKTKSGHSAKTGNAYSIREQEAFILLPGQPYPQKVKLTLDEEATPYQPGVYQIAAQSFFVGRFEQLQVRLRLDRASRKPLSASPKPANG